MRRVKLNSSRGGDRQAVQRSTRNTPLRPRRTGQHATVEQKSPHPGWLSKMTIVTDVVSQVVSTT
jgi:hypothetical protein